MLSFIKWCDSKGFPVPFETDFSKTEGAPASAVSEQRSRTGWSANYPPAYFSAQYPALWAAPTKATAALDAQIMKRNK